ncbi:MAG TPA: CCA tRNA nucleotidyltransferase [Candidatus Acidoferrales bacterium]|nr:CCA tRNA nucleotidyltransferase [Candidatus Acidoferrales bacterium]
MASLTAVCSEVKSRIVPNAKFRAAVEKKAEEIRRAVEGECERAGLAAEVRLDGSVAKDTWILDYADLDIFMRVSPNLTKAQLRDVCLPPAKRALYPNKIVERFAEHPYVEAMVEFGKGRELRVNVVPCYNVERGQWLSATDRSPYHTEYIRQHLTAPQRDEVRLLKAFMRGIGGYGADIKTGGFSGMLCETLIASRGEFERVVKDFSVWRETQFIDVENYYQRREDEVHRIFHEPLIVIDPVDKGRNLGAAVRREQLWNFVGASRFLIGQPSTSIFEEPKIRPLTAADYRRVVKARGSTILAIITGRIEAVVDILWSQMYRTERAVVNLLANNDFSVIRSMSWSDEKSLNVILIELEQDELPVSKKHFGPPVSRPTESASFLNKHLKNKDTISGPWLEGERWVVEKKREYPSARDLLRTALRSGGSDIGVASQFARHFRRRVIILRNESVAALIAKNREFAKAMTIFLSGRPAWLE